MYRLRRTLSSLDFWTEILDRKRTVNVVTLLELMVMAAILALKDDA